MRLGKYQEAGRARPCSKGSEVRNHSEQKETSSVTCHWTLSTSCHECLLLMKTHAYVITTMARQIWLEMKICGLQNKSILRCGHGGIEQFNWSALWEEFTLSVPTLVKFLQKLFPQSSIMLLSCVICQMLKERCKHISLLQRFISALLYGHGTSQKVLEL